MTSKQGAVKLNKIYETQGIDLACELFYVCELGKYLSLYYGESLSLKGIKLDEILTKSPIWVYFCIALKKGWIVDANVSDTLLVDLDSFTLKDWKHYSLILQNVAFTLDTVGFDDTDNINRRRKDEWVIDNELYNKYKYALMTPKPLQICFNVGKTQNRWVFALDGKYSVKGKGGAINKASMDGILAHLSWVSMIAFVAIRRLKKTDDDVLHLSLYLYFNNTLVLDENTLSYFLILYDKTNCFKGWVFYTYDSSIIQSQKSHVGYVAWYKMGLDMGLLSAQEWYDGKAKLDRLAKLDIQVNDVVILFERKDLQKLNHIKEITDMKIAVIESLSENSITLNIINSRDLKHEGNLRFSALAQSIKDMYSVSPFQNLRNEVKQFDWFEIGVEYAMVDELVFIVPLEECDDMKVERVTNGYETVTVALSQEEFIYWLLEDYEVNYNRDRFKQKYFKDRIPLYDSYVLQGKPIPSCYLQ